jgi:hypothetical protein
MKKISTAAAKLTENFSHSPSLRRIFTSDLHKQTFSIKQDRRAVARRLPLKKEIIVCH